MVATRWTSGLMGNSNAAAGLSYYLKADNAALEICSTRQTPCPEFSGTVTKAGLDAGSAAFRVLCDGIEIEACSSSLRLEIDQAVVTLRDDDGPRIGNVRIDDDGQQSGHLRLRFDADDRGGGLHQLVVRVDSSPPTVSPLGGPACLDADPTNDDPREFTVPVPCPLALADVPVEVDVNRAGYGEHRVDVAVVDAAGNVTPVTSASITVPTDRVLDRGAWNGSDASEAARLSARWTAAPTPTLRSRFGRTQRILGRLVNAEGTGIGGARVDVGSLTTSPGARLLAKQPLTTRPDGSWSLSLPRDVSSRELTFGYRSHVNDRVPVATAKLGLRVSAGIRFVVAPRLSAVGRTIALSGRVLGGPLPQRGKILVLQARSPGGRWVPFATIRTRPGGAFASRYRFKQPGAALYQFRAVSPYEAAYPYAAAASRSVRVRKLY
jgi:hypothetical protein